jgi:hypothetical protein
MPEHITFAGPRGYDVITVTPVLDTNIYASGDTLFTTTEVAGVARRSDYPTILKSLYIIDKDDQKPAFDIFLFDRTLTFGAFNVVPAPSDTHAGYFTGKISVVAGDYSDLGGVSVANPTIEEKILRLLGTSLFIAGVLTAGTPTHTASGLVLKFGVQRP